MSHSSNIKTSKKLQDEFLKALSSGTDIRFLIATIESESVDHLLTVSSNGDLDADYGKILENVNPNKPCYILLRTDVPHPSNVGYSWTFISYVPDISPVNSTSILFELREKMIYASTKSVCYKELGEGRFTDFLFTSQKNDLSLKYFKHHLESQESANPLTEQEEEKQRIKAEESHDAGQSAKRSHAQGLNFPCSEDLLSSFDAFSKSSGQKFIVASVAQETEIFTLIRTGNYQTINELELPNNVPCFVLFRFSHEDSHKNVFLYVCPPKAKVQLKMLHSSSKAMMIETIASFGIDFHLKMEVDDLSEVTTQGLIKDLFPVKSESPKAFRKPARPGKGK